MRIVPIALSEYFLNNTPIEDTLRNHNDIYDFCIGKRAKRTQSGQPKFYLYYGEDGKRELTKTIRYYVSSSPQSETCGEIKKEYPNGRVSRLEVHPKKDQIYNCQMFNTYFDSDDYCIDYSYYERECNKIIKTIE